MYTTTDHSTGAAAVLADFRERGFVFRLRGSQLLVRPMKQLNSDELTRLRSHREAIKAIIRDESPPPDPLAGAYERCSQALHWHGDVCDDIGKILERGEINGQPLDARFLATATAALATAAALLQPDRLMVKAWREIPVSR
jgi:hypothetical protein